MDDENRDTYPWFEKQKGGGELVIPASDTLSLGDHTVSEWIDASVLPSCEGRYLVCIARSNRAGDDIDRRESSFCVIGAYYWNHSGWDIDNRVWYTPRVVFWMSIPQPPCTPKDYDLFLRGMVSDE